MIFEYCKDFKKRVSDEVAIMDMKPGKIEIKDTAVLVGLMLHRFHVKLVPIVEFIADNYGLFITESWRTPRRAGDVHSTSPVRAIDLRSWCYPEGVPEEIKRKVNEMWKYDPNRPDMECAVYHKVSGGEMHFHVQVHPNTKSTGLGAV